MNISDLAHEMRRRAENGDGAGADDIQDEIDRRLTLVREFGGTIAGHIFEVLDTGIHTAWKGTAHEHSED